MREFVLLLFILPFCFAQCVQYDQLSVQLRWYHQSEFAGYYAAIDQGFYSQQCLNVSLIEGLIKSSRKITKIGSSSISVGGSLNSGGASIGVDLLGNLFQYRQAGMNLTNVAQIFIRSSGLLVSFTDDQIQTPLDLVNKDIGYYNNSLINSLEVPIIVFHISHIFLVFIN